MTVLILRSGLAAMKTGRFMVDCIGWVPPFRLRLGGVGRPCGGLNAELFYILGVQLLPAAEFHGIGTDHAPDGSSAEQMIEYVESNVPAGCAHCDVAEVDVVPEG